MSLSGWLLASMVVAALVLGGDAISPLTIKGTKFFNSEGDQVFFKGCSLLWKSSWLMVRGCVSTGYAS
jgi:hypothetical protein